MLNTHQGLERTAFKICGFQSIFLSLILRKLFFFSVILIHSINLVMGNKYFNKYILIKQAILVAGWFNSGSELIAPHIREDVSWRLQFLQSSVT